jgi:hypothetical protein
MSSETEIALYQYTEHDVTLVVHTYNAGRLAYVLPAEHKERQGYPIDRWLPACPSIYCSAIMLF